MNTPPTKKKISVGPIFIATFTALECFEIIGVPWKTS